MRINLTDTEAAQIMATYYATQRLEMQIRELNGALQKHYAQQGKIEQAIRKRIKKLPSAPITEWRFNLDPITFEGDVEVPDDKEGEDGSEVNR